MSFAGKVWRLLVGIKDALVLILLLLFFSALFAALSFRPSPAAVREGALLIELEGVVVEEVSPLDPIDLLVSRALPVREYAARDLVAAIDGAASDARIKAVALDLTTFLGGGQVHLREIGAALDRFRATGRHVYAYAVAYTDDSLLLAAHADEAWVDPMGGAVVRGPGGQRLYFARAFERYGINAHVYRVGTYKSAVEPFLLGGMSPEARENAEAIYSGLWEEWRANVMRARPRARIGEVSGDLAALIARSGGDLAKAAQAAGLADRIGSRAEWGEHIARQVGADAFDDTPGNFASTDLDAWLADLAPYDTGSERRLTGSGGTIAVITVAGDIVDDEAGPGTAGAERIAALLDEALDDGLAALVVRIDSPGGTVTGSETIRRAIMRHKAKRIPVVVSMGNVAASGGYWVATTGDRIFAEPETITGSIGVFAMVPSFEQILDRYGVDGDGVSTTPLSGQPDILTGFTPETDALLQASVESAYSQFLDRVAQARGISRGRADELGQGRVWTGGTARQLGLVDQLGDLAAAIEGAARQAQLADGSWQVRYLGGGPPTFATFIEQMLLTGAGAGAGAADAGGSDMVALFARRQQDAATRLIANLGEVFATTGIQARCVECVAAVPVRPSPARGDGALLDLLARLGAGPG